MSRYRLLGRLESGELAELYKAVRDDGTTVTIKLFHEKTSDAAYAREQAQTARILNPLAHAGILHFVEIGTVRKRLAVVREQAEGFSLGQALQRLATKEVILPPPLALHILLQLLEAVQHGHEAGCIHGALTPGNITLSSDGNAYISDFGALRALEASPALKAFLNKGRGTYRAPEVTRGEAVSAESDIYSLGAIAYELLTLRELSPGKGMSVRREAVAPPSRVDRRINARLDPVIMRAVELMPGRRYRQCVEMTSAIRNFLSASGGMPGREDLKKFVRELFPNEVKGDSMGPVPFAEEFELSEIRGAADLPEVDSESSAAVEPRPAFSGETQSPFAQKEAFDFEHSEVSASRKETLAAAPAVVMPPKDEPNFDDGTSPGHAGPLEQGWDAPLGTAVQKSPKLRPGGQTTTPGPPSPLKGRVRVVEDFAPLPTMSQEIREEDAREALTKAKPDAPKRRPTPPPTPKASAKDSYAADPGPTSTASGSNSTSGPLKLSTLEKRVKARGLQQQKMLLAAGAIAIVGVASFGYAIYRFRDKKQPPRSVQIADPSDFETQIKKQPVRAPVTPPKVQDPPARLSDRDPPGDKTGDKTAADSKAVVSDKKELGYLTISSNMAAYVYVDGTKLKGKTPIKRYAVQPGVRAIMLEALSTGERKKFKLSVAKGQDLKIMETFDKKSSRRR